MTHGFTRAMIAAACLAAGAAAAIAGEAAIVRDLESFFRTDDAIKRDRIARRIESDMAWDRSKLRVWLHEMQLWDKLNPGIRQFRVELSDGTGRDIVLRVPENYDPSRQWPLVYALHGTGGNGRRFIGYVEQVLGPRVDQYVIAAPTNYGEAYLHAGDWPPQGEHRQIIRAVRRHVHVDSSRVHVIGYSLGGHASFTRAVLEPDLFAAALPLAGTLLLPDYEELWPSFFDNLRNIEVYFIWGRDDVSGQDLRTPSADGGIAGMNEKLANALRKADVPALGMGLPDIGHGDVTPNEAAVIKWLEARRPAFPKEVHQTFRHESQGHAYWLEAQEWVGPQWDDQPFRVTMEPGESPAEAITSERRRRLGELEGEVDGQTIDVGRKRIKELTIWVGDGMIDWDKPVIVEVSGRRRHAGKLEPDLLVCLNRAAETYDFERLCWVGMRFRSGGKLRFLPLER